MKTKSSVATSVLSTLAYKIYEAEQANYDMAELFCRRQAELWLFESEPHNLWMDLAHILKEKLC